MIPNRPYVEMLATLVLLAAASSVGQETFATPFAVETPDRMMLTPFVDGVLETAEWDSLGDAGGAVSYLQWEPGALHLAATSPFGREIVFSLDMANDGWLRGDDNLEVRLRWDGGRATARLRWLDATPPSGPAWKPAPGFDKALVVAGAQSGELWSVEVTLIDPGSGKLPARNKGTIGIRADGVPFVEDDYPAYLPRTLTPVQFTDRRLASPLEGLKVGYELNTPVMGVGGEVWIRFTFEGSEALGIRRAVVDGVGLNSTNLALLNTPFPLWDNKNRAFVDYRTPIVPPALPGYRIARIRLQSSSGDSAEAHVSYRIAALAEFDWVQPNVVQSREAEQRIRLPFYVRTFSPEVVRGMYAVLTPSGWRAEEGGDRNFSLRGMGAAARRVLQLVVPPGAKGTFPLVFRADLGERTIEQTLWLTIE